MTKEQFCKCMRIIKKRHDVCDVILDKLYEDLYEVIRIEKSDKN